MVAVEAVAVGLNTGYKVFFFYLGGKKQHFINPSGLGTALRVSLKFYR